MDMLHQVAAFAENFDQMVVKIPRMGRRKPDARNIDFADIVHQVGEAVADIGEILAISVYVLPEQRNFLKALAGQIAHFGDDVLRTAAAFLAAGHRHDAVRAELIASVHDVDPCAQSFPFFGRFSMMSPSLDQTSTTISLLNNASFTK